MTWTRLSDNYTDRPEFEDMSLSACYLDVEALVYCNRLLTDGFLPAKKLPRITRSDDPEADMQELIDSGIWWEVEGGYQREWDDQMLATDVERSRADNAERQRRFNESRRDRETRHAAGDHSKCKPEYCSGARGEAKGNLTNALHNAPQTRPDPTRPNGEGKGKATPARPKGRSAPPEEETVIPDPEEEIDSTEYIPDSAWLYPEGTPERAAQENRLNRTIQNWMQEKGDDSWPDGVVWRDAGEYEKFKAAEMALRSA